MGRPLGLLVKLMTRHSGSVPRLLSLNVACCDHIFRLTLGVIAITFILTIPQVNWLLLQRKTISLTMVAKFSVTEIRRTERILRTTESDQLSTMEVDNIKDKRNVTFGPSTIMLFDEELPSSQVHLWMAFHLCHDRWGKCVVHHSTGCNTCSQSSTNEMPRQPRRQ